MNGNLGQLVMVTRAEEAEGFPPLLAEMLWRGNFSQRSEYSVFARGLGPGMVDYVATVFISRRFVEGVMEAHNISAHGTSIEMAIQEVAYKGYGDSPPRSDRVGASPIHSLPNSRTIARCECV